MRIFITGVNGTLGRVLLEELRTRGHEVYGCDLHHSEDPGIFRADISEFRQINREIGAVHPEVVYHLAAEFGRLNGENYYEQLWKTNCLGTRNVIEACINNEAKIIFASSSEAYGAADEYAPAESESYQEGWLDEFAPDFHNEYALTKWTNERQIRIAARHRGLQAMILRFFNAYGPGEHYSPYRSVVCLFCYRLMHGLPITIYKNYSRVFMWVGDWAKTVGNAAEKFVTNPEKVPVFNIGGQEYLSVEELKNKIVTILGEHNVSSTITYLEAEKANVVSKRPSNLLAQTYFSHRPTVTLDQGLPITIDWMKKVYRKSIEPLRKEALGVSRAPILIGKSAASTGS
jgi:dTDP-glucose 4,6-dehydratase